MFHEIMWSGKEKMICLIMVVQREELSLMFTLLGYDINVVTHLWDVAFSSRLELLRGVQIPQFLIEELDE